MTTTQSASLGLQAEAKRDKIHTAPYGDGDAPALGPAFFDGAASFNRVPVVARDMHATLESLDIHHLRTLTALLGECSITAAAHKSGLAQPSVSRMLARMRKVFDDPLLVRSGSKMVLTERGEDLRSPLHEILGQVSRMSANAAFDPRAAEHTFRIACTDCLPTSFVPRLIAAVTGAGSGLDIRIKMADSGFDIAPALEAGELDLVIDNTSNHRADLRISPLYDDEIVCLLSARHPAAGLERLTLARYLSLQHLSPHTNVRWERGPIDGVLAGIGYRRRIAATVPEFNLVPHVLLETNLVFTTGRRFAQPHTEHLPLVIVGAPTEFKSMRFRQIWHDRNRSSPSHRWLRQQVLKVSTSLC